MAGLTIRNVPDQIYRALRARAAQHHRSVAAEVREILATVVKREQRVRMGDAMSAIGRDLGLTNEDFAVFDTQRDNNRAEPPRLE